MFVGAAVLSTRTRPSSAAVITFEAVTETTCTAMADWIAAWVSALVKASVTPYAASVVGLVPPMTRPFLSTVTLR
ncbi:hypothetical protein D3C85_1747490 [compost metagenome]